MYTTYTFTNNLKAKWNYQWNEYCFTNLATYTMIHPNIPNKLWHENFQILRKYVIIHIRLKFGHVHVTLRTYIKLVFILHQIEDNAIPHTADLDHIFFGCAKYQNAFSGLVSNTINNCNVLTPFNYLFILLSIGSRNIYTYILGLLEETGLKLQVIFVTICFPHVIIPLPTVSVLSILKCFDRPQNEKRVTVISLFIIFYNYFSLVNRLDIGIGYFKHLFVKYQVWLTN